MAGDRHTDAVELSQAIDGLMPRVRADLERLVRIPSVSAQGFDPGCVRASAETTAALLEEAGAPSRLLEVPGAHPAVLAKLPAPPGAPTVLLYAHHDVQPAGDEALWTSPPFEPTERGGRLYGRGTNDDKGGIAVHLAALRSFEGHPPVGVTVLIEGEEETGSEHLGEFLTEYGDELRSDVCVVADSGNWRLGEPALTTSLRGLVDCVVEVRTADHAVHSGVFGGAAPDALTALCRLLATLHDYAGRVQVGNRHSAPDPKLDMAEDEVREQAGLLDGVQLIGEGSITSRLWARPAISVLGIDAPTVQAASNQLVPMARAKVSMRLAPGDNPATAMRDLVLYLESNAPWGAKVTVHTGAAVLPYALDATGPAFEAARSALREAWGREPVDMGIGGSIPLVAALAEAFPRAALLLTGVCDPDGREHGENESVHLGELRNACLAEALLLAKLAKS